EGEEEFLYLVGERLHLGLRGRVADDEIQRRDAVAVARGAGDAAGELQGGHFAGRALRSFGSIRAVRSSRTLRPSAPLRAGRAAAGTLRTSRAGLALRPG